MRFAMVTTFYPPYGFGGDASYVRGLSKALVARGHEVDVIHCADAFRLLNGGEPDGEIVADAGVTVHRIESPLGALSPIITQQTSHPGVKLAQLRRLLSKPFDVVHFHNISLVGGLGVLGLSQAPCTLYTLHEHWLLCATHVFWKNRSHQCDKPTCLSCCLRSGTPPQLWRYTGMRDAALRHVDRLISPSEYTASRHRQGGVSARIEVIPHFSAIGNSHGDAPSSLPDPFFLYVGRMTASKGVAELASAFAASPQHNIVFAGDGELRTALMRKYGDCANLHFIGAVSQSQLSAIYPRARALILPSLAPETFGLTVIEAAAFGVPALVRRGAGGAEEIVTQNESGFVYEDGADLMQKVFALAANDDLAKNLGAAAKTAYANRYTLDHHLAAYFACIDEVMAAKRGRG